VRALGFLVGQTRTTVHLWSGSTWPAPEWLDHARSLSPRAVFAVDRAVRELAGTGLGALDPAALCSPGAGEHAKGWDGVSAVIDAGMRRGLGRDGCVVGVGGGAVCDVAAFAASVYMRGVAVELLPTTLLAMVDASVGGKTGINHGGFKNLVGSFHPARRIDMHLAALRTLPPRELASGLAEVVKTAFLGDAELIRILEDERRAVLDRDPDVMAVVVERCVALKGRVVEEDPTETSGRRAVLNLGHTFGHALEAVAGPGRIAHGQAVAWGMGRALDLGLRLGHTDPAYRERAIGLLRGYGFALSRSELAPETAGPDTGRILLAAMRQDKKKHAGGLRFVLQRRLGDTFVADGVPDADVLAALSQEP
jgi:3-dehydroquinate synthase